VRNTSICHWLWCRTAISARVQNLLETTAMQAFQANFVLVFESEY